MEDQEGENWAILDPMDRVNPLWPGRSKATSPMSGENSSAIIRRPQERGSGLCRLRASGGDLRREDRAGGGPFLRPATGGRPLRQGRCCSGIMENPTEERGKLPSADPGLLRRTVSWTASSRFSNRGSGRFPIGVIQEAPQSPAALHPLPEAPDPRRSPFAGLDVGSRELLARNWSTDLNGSRGHRSPYHPGAWREVIPGIPIVLLIHGRAASARAGRRSDVYDAGAG